MVLNIFIALELAVIGFFVFWIAVLLGAAVHAIMEEDDSEDGVDTGEKG